ncbi:vWA domain-containing protein [Candidatus Methylospira mobilis]|uniref:vWA domain-containing protein n=1 Tax=Candidatus Methylospira mobilis TaxID=1808979 RepID=UPI0028E8E2D7|nr:vWA domain-containing protein [Candidatus Methylospira mobilis]WNV03317.1 vWA domain-containing protein [Candidatus Methylospira mobilis]
MPVYLHHPWFLLLLPLAALPYLRKRQGALRFPGMDFFPADPFSEQLARLRRASSALGIGLLGIALTAPESVSQQWIARVGQGAHVVLLVDRSSSMNENFSGSYLGGAAKESKSALTAQLLSDFVAQRPDDAFALVIFSAAPVFVLPLTQDQVALQAALKSLASRGHGITNIATGLEMALDHFRHNTGDESRMIVLVSDGAARMDAEARDLIRQRFQDTQVALYWIYMRSPRSGSLAKAPANANETSSPEYFLHQFFQSMGTPYQAFEAENLEAVQQAIATVGQRNHRPVHYKIRAPGHDLTRWFLAPAWCFLFVYTAFAALEFRR